MNSKLAMVIGATGGIWTWPNSHT